ANNFLAQKLEDTTLDEVADLTTVAEKWSTIIEKFTALSYHVIAAKQAKFDAMKCPNNGNIHEHFKALRLKHNELVVVGVKPSINAYSTQVIGSIPESYQKYLSTVTASARAALLATNAARTAAATAGTGTTTLTISSGTSASSQIVLDPQFLMNLVEEEYDRIQSNKSSSAKAKEDIGVTMTAESSCSGNFGKGKNSTNQHPKGVCWNCGGKGHVQSNIVAPSYVGWQLGTKTKPRE
ncbi:hypothetical protein C8J56DRAFT_767144, partial [Mycena floridula]